MFEKIIDKIKNGKNTDDINYDMVGANAARNIVLNEDPVKPENAIINTLDFIEIFERKDREGYRDHIPCIKISTKSSLFDIKSVLNNLALNKETLPNPEDNISSILNLEKNYAVECRILHNQPIMGKEKGELSERMHLGDLLVINVDLNKYSNLHLTYTEKDVTERKELRDFIKMCRMIANKVEEKRYATLYKIDWFTNIAAFTLEVSEDNIYSVIRNSAELRIELSK